MDKGSKEIGVGLGFGFASAVLADILLAQGLVFLAIYMFLFGCSIAALGCTLGAITLANEPKSDPR